MDKNTLFDDFEQKTPEIEENTPASPPPGESFSRFVPEDVASPVSDIPEISEADIFSTLESQFDNIARPKPAVRAATKVAANPIDVSGGEGDVMEVDEIMSAEMIEISADVYVEMLESVVEAACQWISGIDKNYTFRNTLKERYKKVSATFMAHQNLRITPGHLFALMTVFVVYAPLQQANKDRLKKRRISDNKKAMAGVQGSTEKLFETETVFDTRTSFVIAEKDGLFFYKMKPGGGYAKEDEREEVPKELALKIVDYYNSNGKWPKLAEFRKIKNMVENGTD